MEFRLDDAQIELRQTVARFAEQRFPTDALASREGVAVDADMWAEMGAMGIFGLLAPEALGGSGLGLVEGAIVFEQLGTGLVPGPILWTVLAAGIGLDEAVAGSVRIGGIDRSMIEPDGTAIVEHAADIDVLLVVGDERITVLRTDDLAPASPLDPLDPLTPVGRFTDLAAAVEHDAERRVGSGRVEMDEAVVAFRHRGAVLSAAMLSGVAQRALDVAREYALTREQFGVPIGSFQAVKHLLADMHVRVGLAQSETYAAAALLDDSRTDRDTTARVASGAKLLAGDAAIANASSAIQILGGMGFTWDMLPNYLLKRAWVLINVFGTADEHAEVLGRQLVTTSPSGGAA